MLVPPLHHAVVTARVRATDLRKARLHLEQALQTLDARYPLTPAGLGVTVAWGLPYFRRHVAKAAATHLPFDRRAGKPALLDARRFPSDPKATLLEANDVAILLRSDHVEHIDDALHALFDRLDVFAKTSVRRGFVGGGFKGGPGLPRLLAMAAGVPGADLIPHGAELFLGFTSSQKAALGPSKIANFETLGLVDLRGGYFHGGTHMHLSHIAEDLEAWYLGLDFSERVTTAFRPGPRTSSRGRRRCPRARARARMPQRSRRAPPHTAASAIAPRSSRPRACSRTSSGPTARSIRRGRRSRSAATSTRSTTPSSGASLQGAIAWRSSRSRASTSSSFNPSSDDFHRNRLAMDGVLPGGKRLATSGQYSRGFNEILQTTHRQNFLVPPRKHRSFPLAEL